MAWTEPMSWFKREPGGSSADPLWMGTGIVEQMRRLKEITRMANDQRCLDCGRYLVKSDVLVCPECSQKRMDVRKR